MCQFPGKIFKSILLCFFLLAGSNSCKDDNSSVIPYVYVNMNINPNNLIELNVPYGSYYFAEKGFGGIILFRDLTDNSNPYFAFDAACTNEVLSTVRVEADASGIATCPECGSRFLLVGGYGTPVKGPAVQPLRQYHTYYTGGRIIITN